MAHISVSSQTTLLNPVHFFVFALYDASAPTVLLESIAPTTPYGNPLQVTFSYNCVNGHIYIIKLWESVNSSPAGTVRNDFKQTISLNSVEVRLPEYLEVDITAGLVSGATSYVDTSWVGWDYIIRRNPNTMIPDDTTNTNPTHHVETTGGFTLIQADDIFQPNEKFIVEFIPKIIVAAPGGTPSDPFSAGRIITADETLTTADLSTALMIRSATSKIALTLPLLSAVSDFRFMYFYSCGGSHINARFIGQGADKFNYPGNLSEIALGQTELLVVYKAFGAWQIHNDLFGVKQVGELLYNYKQTEQNAIICAGQLLNRDEYPRLWAWVQTLEAGVVVTESAWSSTFVTHNGNTVYTKKACFSTGDGSTTFRLPLLTASLLKAIDGSTRIPGSIGLDQVGQHSITLSLVQHTASGTPKGVTDGPAGAPTTLSFVQLAGQKNIMENSGVYILIRY